MKIATLRLFVFCWILFASTGVFAQQKYSLKSNFPEGRYTMQTETIMNMTMQMGGQIAPSEQKQIYLFDVTALAKAPDGSQQLSLELTRIQMSVKTRGREILFDTNDEEDAVAPLKVLRLMLGMKQTLTRSPEGKIVKIEGMEEHWQKLLEGAGPAEKTAIENLKKTTKVDTFSKNFDRNQEVLPTQPVALGEIWKTEAASDIPLLGPVRVQAENVLQSVEKIDGVETAFIQSKVKTESQDPKSVEMGGVKMQFKNLKIDTDTTVMLEIPTGLLTSNHSKLTIYGVIVSEPNEKQNLEVIMNGEGETKMLFERKAE